MEKKRWVFIFSALCLALVFSVSSVEAQKNCDADGDGAIKETNKCLNKFEGQVTDPNDDNPCIPDPNAVPGEDCSSEPDPPPSSPDFPIIATVTNHFGGGGAAGHITSEILEGIYTSVSVSKFNKLTPSDLRKRYDVLHFHFGSTRTIDLDWQKLSDFMNTDLIPCGGEDPPCKGGGILIEDPANIEDLKIDGLMLNHVEGHTTGDDTAIVEFVSTAPTLLRAFTALDEESPRERFNMGGLFKPGSGTSSVGPCADTEVFFGPTRGLGFGCFVNNHIIFAEDPGLGLIPFLLLEGAPWNFRVVGVYGEHDTSVSGSAIFGNGRIIIQGIDHGFHGGGGGTEFQANHFCALTNELIWLSQLDPTENLTTTAMDDCVRNVLLRIDAVTDGP